jgi:1-acyl-sn-glycerol-3-phosphate acyltransferase
MRGDHDPAGRAGLGAIAAAVRTAVRLCAVCALLLAGLAIVLAVFPVLGEQRRQATIARWSQALLAACGVRLAVRESAGVVPLAQRPGGRMVLANHVSWLDIFMINAVAPSCFVAKADIAHWPLVGTLVARVGTLFLRRDRRHAVHEALQRMQGLLAQGRRLAVFPEGTTSIGDRLLPFHGNLVEAAVQAGVAVDPVGLRYRGLAGEFLGEPDATMHFVGDISFVASLLRILAAPGVVGEVHVCREVALLHAVDGQGPDVAGSRARHRVAQEARHRISQALDLPLEDRLPDVVRDLRAARL